MHFMESPLKVYYPYGGKHFIAIWWTHNEQNQFVVSKTKSGMDAVLNSIINKFVGSNYTNDSVEVRKSFEIEIVAPPLELCEKAAKIFREKEVSDFFREVCYSFSELKEHKLNLPSTFEYCNKYEEKYPSKPQGKESDDPKHYDCLNCYNKIKLATLSMEAFHEKYHESWSSADFNRSQYVSKKDPLLLTSRAELASSEKILWAATPNFGHHASGTSMDVVEDDRLRDVLFYFHIVQELSVDHYEIFLKNRKLKQQEENKKWQQEQGKLRKNKILMDLKNKLSVFTGK